MVCRVVPLDYVVAPEEVIETGRRGDEPAGIYWDELPAAKIEAISVLAALRPPDPQPGA